MSKLNPLDHPICLAEPARMAPSAWTEHVPFGMFAIDLLRPRLVVELGTHFGVSYCAFCQAVKALEIEAHCYAVDTWKGDPDSGFYGPEVLADLRAHHDPLYGGFSRLIESTFDDALEHFEDSTIDLLHIDGYHTYAAVKHDFEAWLPKVSRRGVVLLHDVNVRQGDFGAWRVWQELKQDYPTFEFIHAHGLGVVAVGKSYPAAARALFEATEEDVVRLRSLFSRLGYAVAVTPRIAALTEEVATRTEEVTDRERTRHEQVTGLLAQISEHQQRLETLRLEVYRRTERVLTLTREASAYGQRIQELEAQRAHGDKQTQALLSNLDATRKANQSLISDLGMSQVALEALQGKLAEKDLKTQTLEGKIADSERRSEALQAGLIEAERHLESLKADLGHKEAQLQTLAASNDANAAQLAMRLHEVEASKVWRLTTFLRGLPSRVLSPRSLPGRMGRKMGRALLLPFRLRRTYRYWRDLQLIRGSDLFEPAWYLQENPDVARSGADPGRHYLVFGGFEGRDPGPRFASRWYLETHGDVRKAQVNPLVHYLRFGRMEGRLARPRPLPAGPPPEQAAVLFLSGCAGDAQRYRCVHQLEELSLRGYACDSVMYGDIDLGKAASKYRCLILHRVPYGPDVQEFIQQAKLAGNVVLFETDDLVFDPDAAEHIAALDLMNESERRLYHEGLQRYRATLLDCDGVSVTTEHLCEEAAKLGRPVAILPNVVSREMVRQATEALNAPQDTRDGQVAIAYLSGTYTHNDDFLEAADAVLWALKNYPFVRLVIVGPLDLDRRFEKYSARIQRIPFQPWQNLPEILRGVEISLAPLEKSNRFTESKSCIKYLEAGLLKVPTVASKRKDFVRAIGPGQTGFLADTPEEWQAGLRALVESPSLRTQIGQNAYDDVHANHTTVAYADHMERDLRHLIEATGHPKSGALAINWIMRAPIAATGGGYRTIFRLANYLGSRGHTVRLYVEPIAHLAGLEEWQVISFCWRSFGPLAAEVYVGHDHILPADVTIATNWPTAPTVAHHRSSLYKFYFVQDYEPEFYERDDPSYDAARKTYDLPLQPITIGGYLADRLHALNGQTAEVVPFGTDSETFNVRQAPEKRKGKPRVLFFARPGLKRRGYEIGIKALEIAKQRNPNLSVAFFGAESKELGTIPFEFANLGVLSPDQLAQEMNRSHILLSLSLTNISWVPYEGMACGLAVVEVDTPAVRRMVDEKAICLAAPNAQALSEAVVHLADDGAARVDLANSAVEFMKGHTWAETCVSFERILLERCIL